MNKSILISGASSGIGKALSMELDKQGYQVFAGVRRTEDADALRNQASGRLIPVLLDVTLPETIAETRRIVSEQTGGELYCLVNNAGISVGGALEFLPVLDFRQQMEVNLIGQLALTQICLPMLRKNHGRVIFVSSAAGRLAAPFNGPYSASKAALVAMADTLRQELAPWKVTITVLIVGSVQTPIWEKSSRMAGEILSREPAEAREYYYQMQKRAGKFYRSTGQNGIPVSRVVNITQRELESSRPREYVLVGSDAIFIELMVKLLPVRWRDWIIRRQMGLLKIDE